MNERSPVHDNNGATVTLREYIEAIMSERDRALTAAFTAQQSALNLATRNLELRLEKLNELRQEVTQDRGEYVKREVYESRVNIVEKRQAWMTGVGAALVVLIPIITFIIARATA